MMTANIVCLADGEKMERKHKGGWSELVAASWLLEQGFEVFRNVSQHGLADLIGWRNGEFFLFDVKSSNNRPTECRRVTAEQFARGVKLIIVSTEGNCKIMDPLGPQTENRNCAVCGRPFISKRGTFYCSDRCRSSAHLARKAAKAELPRWPGMED